MSLAHDFLVKHHMEPERVAPAELAEKMAEDMRRGLKGEKSSLPMIATYLSNDGAVPEGSCAAVIDAGGTNFRSALVRFEKGGYTVEELRRWKMPGIETPCTWDEFIAFTADHIQHLMDKTEVIGFCFSYNADITPDMDGRVKRIDKEVVVKGCENRLVAASLNEELGRRGIHGKKIVILNDTAAALLGGTVTLDKSAYSGFIGQISGTGTNTCTSVPRSMIEKLNLTGSRGMLVNLESGSYDGIESGDFDLLLDSESNNPGEKDFEKKTAGVYLGELCRLMLLAAGEEGLLSAGSLEKAKALGHIDSAVIDAWSAGEKLEDVAVSAADGDFVRELSLSLFQRSARCMCVNLLAIALLTGAGKEAARPVCVCAEGSLVQRSHYYRPTLEQLLDSEGREKLGLHFKLMVGSETTLPGSAAAALLNC